MKIDLTYKVGEDISKFPLPAGNFWMENLKWRNHFHDDDGTKKADHNFFSFFTVDGKMIMNRKYDIPMPETRIENGVYYWDFPIDRKREQLSKDGTNPVVTPHHLLFSYYCSLEGVEEGSDLYNKIINLPRAATINLLKRKHDDVVAAVATNHNDILLNGKKVWGEERTINTHGVYSIGNTVLNVSEYADFYAPIFQKEIELNKASGKGITGVEDEIPGYTKDAFIKDYLAEVNRLIKEIEEA